MKYLSIALTLGLLACGGQEATTETKKEAPVAKTKAKSPRADKTKSAPIKARPPLKALTEEQKAAALLNPELHNRMAPEKYAVTLKTTKGDVIVEIYRAWAPTGADRFYHLSEIGYYDQNGFFRYVPNFVVQWGLNGDPAVNTAWKSARITDDKKNGQSNDAGTITFATSGPNSRTTQLFINLKDNARLDGMGFTPFGKVIKGMDIIKNLNAEYGQKPNQGLITSTGNAYLKAEFPKLDYIKTIVVAAGAPRLPAKAPATVKAKAIQAIKEGKSPLKAKSKGSH